MRVHSLNRFTLRYAVATAQSGHAVNLGERAREDQGRMIFNERDYTFIIRTVGVMVIGPVHQNCRLRRRLSVDVAHFILGGSSGSGTVRTPFAEQPFLSIIRQ